MPASAPSKLRLPLAVVAHDAGAANLLLGWIATLPPEQLRLCVTGPAEKLCAVALPYSPRTSLDDALAGAALLLSGTSGPHSSLEHEARRIACARGLLSVAAIDHWVNYTSRFVRDGVQVLPDELWVVDEYAVALAQEAFPGCPVFRLPNCYLETLCAEAAAATSPHPGATHVLYALEPMRSSWGRGEIPGEFQALDYFLTHAAALGLNAETHIRLRPHPSEPPEKYTAWLAAARAVGTRVELDSSPTLSASLGWADWVIGCESYALVAGLAAGRRVVSSLPPWAPPCRLPHEGVIKLHQRLNEERLAPTDDASRPSGEATRFSSGAN